MYRMERAVFQNICCMSEKYAKIRDYVLVKFSGWIIIAFVPKGQENSAINTRHILTHGVAGL